jgi:3-oxoacyl-[acyl-carrier-protein] synthase II
MTAAERKVVVTGMGAVTAAGPGVDRFWRACVGGTTALRRDPRFAAGADAIPPAGVVGDPLPDGEERASGLALLAGDEALRGAGFADGMPPRGTGLVLGTCLGGSIAALDWLDAGDARSVRSPGSAPSPGAAPSPRPAPFPEPGGLSAPALRLAARHRLSGPVASVSTACASGTLALLSAADAIRRGESDVMLAGGVDALSTFVVSGFALLRVLASDEVRPFDRRRDGLALGEGAGIVVLEEAGSARRRGAPILAEWLGGGTALDAYHMTGPSPGGDGVVRAVTAALADARLTAGAVDFISAHGTGTTFNDRMETNAFKRLFGARAARIPIDSVKPIIGHTLGAAGALEAILCVRVLLDGLVPPTINYRDPDPECDLDYVPNEARRVAVRRALSTSSAFAGHNAALLLGAP